MPDRLTRSRQPGAPRIPPTNETWGETLIRLAEARAAWVAYITATTRDQHFAATARLHNALAITDKDLPDEGC